jgi:hypothetical protein
VKSYRFFNPNLLLNLGFFSYRDRYQVRTRKVRFYNIVLREKIQGFLMEERQAYRRTHQRTQGTEGPRSDRYSTAGGSKSQKDPENHRTTLNLQHRGQTSARRPYTYHQSCAKTRNLAKEGRVGEKERAPRNGDSGDSETSSVSASHSLLAIPLYSTAILLSLCIYCTLSNASWTTFVGSLRTGVLPLVTTSNVNLTYLNCILAGLNDRKGEEA